MSTYQEIELMIRELSKILINFQKAANRNYLRSTLIQKSKISANLYNHIKNLLAEHEEKLVKTEFEFLLKSSRKIYSEIINIINAKLQYAENLHRNKLKLYTYIIIFCNRLKTSLNKNMAFDLKSASALVEVYNGDSEKLDQFVDSATLLIDLTTAQNKPTLFKFLKTRLTGKARHAFYNVVENDPADLVQKVKTCCASNVTPESVMAKMRATKQNSTSTDAFCAEVEKLTEQLANQFVLEDVPGPTASKLATKTGIDTLINGINNSETKLILKAGSFKTINEAIQKVYENNQQSSNTATVLSYSARQRGHSNRGNMRNYARGGHSNRGRNYNNNNNNYYPQRQNNYPRRGRGGHRGSNYSRGGHGRVFYASQNQNSMPSPTMQQGQNQMLMQPMQPQQHQQPIAPQATNNQQPQIFLGTANSLNQF